MRTSQLVDSLLVCVGPNANTGQKVGQGSSTLGLPCQRELGQLLGPLRTDLLSTITNRFGRPLHLGVVRSFEFLELLRGWAVALLTQLEPNRLPSNVVAVPVIEDPVTNSPLVGKEGHQDETPAALGIIILCPNDRLFGCRVVHLDPEPVLIEHPSSGNLPAGRTEAESVGEQLHEE